MISGTGNVCTFYFFAILYSIANGRRMAFLDPEACDRAESRRNVRCTIPYYICKPTFYYPLLCGSCFLSMIVSRRLCWVSSVCIRMTADSPGQDVSCETTSSRNGNVNRLCRKGRHERSTHMASRLLQPLGDKLLKALLNYGVRGQIGPKHHMNPLNPLNPPLPFALSDDPSSLGFFSLFFSLMFCAPPVRSLVSTCSFR